MHIMRCEDCFSTIQQYIISISAANAGSTTSAAKAEAARANGKKGGRPKKL